MAMTKKHYEMVANVLYRNQSEDRYKNVAGPVTRIARELADDFAADNEMFDRARFLKACGVQS